MNWVAKFGILPTCSKRRMHSMPISKEKTLTFSDFEKKQAFKLEMSFWKRRIEQNDLSETRHISAVTVETVDENAAFQMKPLIFTHLPAFGENFDQYFPHT
jgi:hypothetical protein